MASKQEQLHALIAPVAASLGCELWGLEYLTQGRYTTVRIYIDREEGVSLEDCEKVSRQVSSVMDVEDPIDSEYTLEVSSPGMDRPLYTLEQYARYIGEQINVRLRLGSDEVVAIPDAAVQFGSQGNYVYVIGGDDTASVRQVQLGAAHGDRVAVVGDRLYTDVAMAHL